jgi:hypothetical protein
MEGNLQQSKSPTELGSLSCLSVLLAGPILRRVDTNQVCIWIACSPTTDLRNTKSTMETLDGKDSNVIGFGTAESIKLGDHLHIGLVTAHPIITSTDSDAFQGKNPHFQQMSSPSTRDV